MRSATISVRTAPSGISLLWKYRLLPFGLDEGMKNYFRNYILGPTWRAISIHPVFYFECFDQYNR